MGFWIHDGFLDSRWLSGFTMDFWIHDGFKVGGWCSLLKLPAFGGKTKQKIAGDKNRKLLGVRAEHGYKSGKWLGIRLKNGWG